MKAVFPGQRELVQSDSWARAMETYLKSKKGDCGPDQNGMIYSLEEKFKVKLGKGADIYRST